MTRKKTTDASSAATQRLVGHDVGFLLGLLSTLQQRQGGHAEGSTWLLLSYLDWVSLTLYEIRELPRKGITISAADAAMQFDKQLADSRHSSKLLDSNSITIEDQLRAFRESATKHRDQLIKMTRAPRLVRCVPWFAGLQDDTGIVLCGEDVLATTLSIRYHVGLQMDSDDAAVFDRAREMGALLASFADENSARWAAKIVAANLSFPSVHAMDTRFAEFYGSTFKGAGIPESMTLSTIACRLRSALVMTAAVRGADESARLLSFKFRFAIVWQVASTMRTILDSQTYFRLDTQLLEDLREVLDAQSVAAMADPELRQLRNVLVHYKVLRRDAVRVDIQDPLLGLPQALCSGRTWLELDTLSSEAGIELAQMLDRWSGAFKHLLREPS